MSTTKGGPADIQAADPFAGMSPGDKAQAYNYVMCRQQSVQKTESSTAAAKDTAQSSAAGSVSLALITVLKNTLDKGPDGAHYYYFSLVLIIVALIIQIIIGFLSMTIILVGRRVKENDQIIKESQEWLKQLYASAGGDPAKLTFPSPPKPEANYDEPQQDSPELPKLILKPAPPSVIERDTPDAKPKGYGSIPPGEVTKVESKWHAFLQWLKLRCCCCFYNKEEEDKDNDIEKKILYLCKKNEEEMIVCPPAGEGQQMQQQQADEPTFPGPPAAPPGSSSDPQINLPAADPAAPKEYDEPPMEAAYQPQSHPLISKEEAIKDFCDNAWEDEAKQKFFDGQKAAIVQKREVDGLHNMQRVITYLFYVVLLLNGLIAAFVVGG